MASKGFSDLGRDLERQVKKAAQDAQRSMVRKGQPAFDRVFAEYQGQPVEAVLPPLRSALARAGITPDRRELRELAQHVTDGERVRFKAGSIR